MRTGIVCVYSGGMDSFTVLHRALQYLHEHDGREGDLHPISFNYGQRHRKELLVADHVIRQLGLEFQYRVINLTAITPLLQGSALTSRSIEVPEGHYEAETMRQTVVPGRNTIMLSIAAGYAESLTLVGPYDQMEVWYGAHAGDHHIYPDCRPEFVESMARTIRLATDGKVILRAPFLDGNKETILRWGYAHGLDYSKTWTCYKGERHPCGKCGACQERAEAFAAIGKPDPALVPA